jgi:glyoxylase-like metal-dependent hydrolase (beta-lactamase superfamily II)
VIERGWLSSNNILFLEGDQATLVDSGYHSHAAQTLALVRQGLEERRLARIVNTHSHSDHIGGNALLQRQFGCGITIPAGIAGAVERWDEDALMLRPAAQQAERFRFDATLQAGDEFEMGGLVWRALAAPGHDMDALVFHCEAKRLLISGDALWRDGFGVMFAEVMGSGEGLKATRATVEAIGRLSVNLVIPGHGPAFSEFDDAVERALARVRAFEEDPLRMVRNAIKVCFTFLLLAKRSLPLAGVADLMRSVPFFHEINRRYFALEDEAFAAWLVQELLKAGAIEVREGQVVPRMAA